MKEHSMKKWLIVLGNWIDEMNSKHIDQYTSQCAYFTILSFIPLVMLILTLTKYLGIGQDNFFDILNRMLPGDNLLNEAVLGIVKEVYSKSLGTVTISAIFILWSSGKGFLALCKGLDIIYEVPENKQFMYFQIKAIVCTILFIALIIGTLLMLVFGNSINGLLQEKFNIVSEALNHVLRMRHLIVVIVLTAVLSFAYRFIPRHDLKWKQQLPGALFAAIACDVISIFYSVYVDVFTGFSVMYGSLTSAVLAMMWLYACMYCVLFGAIINHRFAKQK